LKNNKAGGTDSIIPELIKQGGRTLKQKLHKLLIMIWEDEQMPDQWNEEIICLVYKNGDRLNCTYYRPITLLNNTYKNFAIIMNKRLTHIIEEDLSDFQSGFHQNRSTIDNIFMLRQIVEKCYEHNIDIHNVFIDDTLAFDSVKRNKIIECLFQYRIPVKLIRLKKFTLEKTEPK
jgi:hypothetical protein